MSFSNILRDWYLQNRRDLPWRETSDPFKIWVSEIILQQTRVSKGLDYYHKFISRFPDIQSLAMSSLEDVLKIWQGLGYYTRARNMHDVAMQVVDEHNGEFPQRYAELIKLKGIGPYTAAAIASFTSGEAKAVVDGNVERLLARYLGISEAINRSSSNKIFREEAEKLLDMDQPGLHNQAIMEFGALHCTPSNPLCDSCPFKENCYAFNYKMTGSLPVKHKSGKQGSRYFHYLVVKCKDSVYLSQRKGKDIWHSLYEFPVIETITDVPAPAITESLIWKQSFGDIPFKIIRVSETVRHQLSHQLIYARFYELECLLYKEFPIQGAKKIALEKISDYPVPRIIEKYFIASGWLQTS